MVVLVISSHLKIFGNSKNGARRAGGRYIEISILVVIKDYESAFDAVTLIKIP